MSQPGYLVDTSAFVRFAREPELRSAWREQFGAGLIAVCPVTELEIFYGARSKANRDELRTALRTAYSWAVIPDRVFERAMSVQDALIDRGAHRSAGPVDLLVAATAESHGMTVLHYDADFLQVAEVTGQPVRWVAEPGSIV
jgi:predicted nucleic acid-binding protein